MLDHTYNTWNDFGSLNFHKSLANKSFSEKLTNTRLKAKDCLTSGGLQEEDKIMNPMLVFPLSTTSSEQLKEWIPSLRNTWLLYLPKQWKMQIHNLLLHRRKQERKPEKLLISIYSIFTYKWGTMVNSTSKKNTWFMRCASANKGFIARNWIKTLHLLKSF